MNITPLVCLRDRVFFPGLKNSLEVARPQSINAINMASFDKDGYIVVSAQKDYRVDEPTFEDIFDVGVLCQIDSVVKDNNRIFVNLFGVARVKIKSIELDPTESFLMARHQLISNIHPGENLGYYMIKIKKKLLKFYDKRMFQDLMSDEELVLNNDPDYMVDLFVSRFIDKFSYRQILLETIDPKERMMRFFDFVLEIENLEMAEKELDSKVKEKLENSQKEYILKEKMRIIKEELDDHDSDLSKMLEAFENEPFPKHVKEKAKEEIRRYEMMQSTSPEANTIRNYLDWLYHVPWYQKSEDNNDLNKALAILNEDHFGLEKVKERILEYLAVKSMTNSLKAPIICLSGPPGVGKTSLAKSVARALNREFVKQSLGGVKDEAEIRGHRRTYVGSLPGRIIQGMKKAKTINPVFLIDEIDKMSSDYKGDPSSAMLEVLDPEQNFAFSDNYLEEPYDLSNVLFIATANYIENIPSALLDRLELIELSSYTELEKVQIAKKYLIPKQLKYNGLNEKQFSLSDSVVLFLIRSYTREAGVRNLERIISSLCRKACLGILKDGKKTFKITNAQVKKWLGPEIFEHGVKNKKDEVGVVTGLAYTSFGGDILPIEVTYFEGKGKVIVTGQLGDVMKESSEIALDWVKANAKELGIDYEWFQNHDIHIHAPEGAVPKDGPSAGITMVSAIVSALTNRKIKRDVAMTGEVTLRGNVLPIGGLKEKTLAAHRSGITKVIIPKGNVKDLEKIAKEVLESVEIVSVSHVNEVLKEIFV